MLGIENSTVLVLRMDHRKEKETQQQPIMLPGPAVPGSCLVSFHILWAILSKSTVQKPKLGGPPLIINDLSRIT